MERISMPSAFASLSFSAIDGRSLNVSAVGRMIRRDHEGAELQIRNCTEEDIKATRNFVSLCKPLGLHTGYTYWMLFHYFGQSCFLMEEDGAPIGYVSGMKSDTFKDVFFLWQIGVAPEFRGRGYAYLLLHEAVKAAKRLECTAIQFTIEADNNASFNTFSGFAKKNNLKMSSVGELKYPHSVRETMEEETIYEIVLDDI
jgi:L-2,4-diaminobutyric acid acetyltransferase